MSQIKGAIRRMYAISGICATLCLMGCCSRTSTVQQYSPDGKYEARVSEEDCGATSHFITDVDLISTHATWSYFNRANVFNVISSGDAVNVTWVGNSRLEITCKHCASKEPKIWNRNWRGIVISYEGDHPAISTSDRKSGVYQRHESKRETQSLR